jgi:hypothetical protein
MTTVSAVVFSGVVDVKHQSGPVTEEDLREEVMDLPITEPTGFMFGQQRFKEMLEEVMGA